ncbi:MAG: hypothetical protein IPP50_16320 [Piscinibacter sp.]|nr:hypothetical protein [Piscinibacter sp.]
MTLIYTSVGVRHFAKKASEEGALEVLMSRQSFGFLGASYQLIAYGLLGAVYFALEGHVMASALTELTGWSEYVSAAIICLIFIPLSIYGMKFLSVFQGATIWLYVIGIAFVLVGVSSGWSAEVSSANAGEVWWQVNPNKVPFNWLTVLRPSRHLWGLGSNHDPDLHRAGAIRAAGREHEGGTLVLHRRAGDLSDPDAGSGRLPIGSHGRQDARPGCLDHEAHGRVRSGLDCADAVARECDQRLLRHQRCGERLRDCLQEDLAPHCPYRALPRDLLLDHRLALAFEVRHHHDDVERLPGQLRT